MSDQNDDRNRSSIPEGAQGEDGDTKAAAPRRPSRHTGSPNPEQSAESTRHAWFFEGVWIVPLAICDLILLIVDCIIWWQAIVRYVGPWSFLVSVLGIFISALLVLGEKGDRVNPWARALLMVMAVLLTIALIWGIVWIKQPLVYIQVSSQVESDTQDVKTLDIWGRHIGGWDQAEVVMCYDASMIGPQMGDEVGVYTGTVGVIAEIMDSEYSLARMGLDARKIERHYGSREWMCTCVEATVPSQFAGFPAYPKDLRLVSIPFQGKAPGRTVVILATAKVIEEGVPRRAKAHDAHVYIRDAGSSEEPDEQPLKWVRALYAPQAYQVSMQPSPQPTQPPAAILVPTRTAQPTTTHTPSKTQTASCTASPPPTPTTRLTPTPILTLTRPPTRTCTTTLTPTVGHPTATNEPSPTTTLTPYVFAVEVIDLPEEYHSCCTVKVGSGDQILASRSLTESEDGQLVFALPVSAGWVTLDGGSPGSCGQDVWADYNCQDVDTEEIAADRIPVNGRHTIKLRMVEHGTPPTSSPGPDIPPP